MKVLIVEPGVYPYIKHINGLKEMKEVVGGPIQGIYPFKEKVAVVCNDEGLLMNLPFNRWMPGGYDGVFGTFFICGLGEDDFCSLTEKQIRYYRKYFKDAQYLMKVKTSETGKITPVIMIRKAKRKTFKNNGREKNGIND